MAWGCGWNEGRGDERQELRGMAQGGPLPLGPQGFKEVWALRRSSGSSTLVAGPGVTSPSCWTQVPPHPPLVLLGAFGIA